MEKDSWDSKIEYLKSTRENMWNDDYFEFLVKCVWKFDCPKNIVDFGCGYGYLGMKLLPLLPEGSTYTGIDIGDKLLHEARSIFDGSSFNTSFIQMDLTQYIPIKQYDIAICQAVLRHIPQARDVLSKMVDSVVPSGMVICIEVNRQMEEAGKYVHNINGSGISQNTNIMAVWEDELSQGGRDYMLGIRVPVYMERLGLINVGVRLNDFIEFISPQQDNYDNRVNTIVEYGGFNGVEIHDDSSVLFARSLIVSYGTKK